MRKTLPIIIKTFIAAILVIIFATSLTSCRKGLCYNHYRALGVTFEWDQVWERDYGANIQGSWGNRKTDKTYHELIPDIANDVTVIVYNVEDDDDISVMYVGNASASVSVSDGENSLLFFNEDVKYVDFNDLHDRYSATITAHEYIRSTYDALPGEVTVREPDMIYGSYVSRLAEILNHERQDLEILMTPLTFTYVVHFTFARGAEHVSLARGALTGMARGVYLRDGCTTPDEATILFDGCEACDHGFISDVVSFGLPDFHDEAYNGADPHRDLGKQRSSAAVNRLNLEVRLTNGSIKNFWFDVTDQLAKQPMGGVIAVDGLIIEDDENIGSGGGLDVEVDSWGDTIETVVPFDPNQQ